MQNTKAFDLTGRIKLCKVLYVHDGDSMTIAFIHRSHKWKLGVKLYGVNAPELYPEPTAENRTMIITKAARARDALREKVHNKYVFVEFQEKDRYGRWLVTITTQRRNRRKDNVNDWMISQGMAVRYFDEIQMQSPMDCAVDRQHATANSEDMVRADIKEHNHSSSTISKNKHDSSDDE
jgi:endonuclease YncB( thermonuclease family)